MFQIKTYMFLYWPCTIEDLTFTFQHSSVNTKCYYFMQRKCYFFLVLCQFEPSVLFLPILFLIYHVDFSLILTFHCASALPVMITLRCSSLLWGPRPCLSLSPPWLWSRIYNINNISYTFQDDAIKPGLKKKLAEIAHHK